MAFMPGMGPPPEMQQQPMMSGLGGLAQGLRSAGGILSPSVYKSVQEEDQLRERQAQAERMMQIQQTVKGIEMGAIEPEAGKQVLARLGFQAPVGASPEAQARADLVKQRQGMAEAMAKLPPDATFEQRIGAMTPYMTPDQNIKLYDTLVNKQQTLELRRDQIQQTHELRLANAGTAEARAAEIARHNKAMEALGNERLMLTGTLSDMRQRADEDRRQANVDRQVTAFANNLQNEKLPSLYSSIRNANTILKKYEGKMDLPGVGVIEGSKWIPNIWRTDEGKNLRGSLQAVSNDLLNLYSGLAVTLPEAERRELEEMRGGNFTEIDFKNAWPRTIDRFNAVMGNLRAGASEQVYREYQGRPGALKLDPVDAAFGKKEAPAKTEAKPTGERPVQINSDAEFDSLAPGTEFIGPDGKRRRKP